MNTNITNKNNTKINNSIKNNKKYLLNNYSNNINVASNISMHKNANYTNYEGSAIKVNEILQNKINVNNDNKENNNLNIQKNNYLENNDKNNIITEDKKINNNDESINKQKNIKPRQEKDNCCCLIF